MKREAVSKRVKSGKFTKGYKNCILILGEDLFSFVKRMLKKCSVPEDEARIISKIILCANLRGVDSHGIIRLPIYIKRLREGTVRPAAEITIIRETPSIAVIDGHHSFGQIVGYRAMELAIQKARNSSISVVGVRNSEHYGAAAFYAMMPLKKNMIGISITNTTPLMAPTGGKKRLLGNNPIGIAIPAGKESPIVVDISTSVAALGKILLAAQKAEKIPIEWGRDSLGNLTNDPDSLDSGTLNPIGEHKGYALAVAFDVLSGVLTGSGFTTGVNSIYRDINKPNRCGHFMMAINICDFLPISTFTKRIQTMTRQIRESPRIKGNANIYLPGEVEYLTEKKRNCEGIPIEKELIKELNKLALDLNVVSLNGARC